MTNELLVDPSDLVHIDNTETINGLKYFSHDTVVANASQMITNCITEIPQNVKLELNDGVLTLKAGSKVYIPNGFEQDGTTKKFNTYTFDTDYTISIYVNSRRALFLTNDNQIVGQSIDLEFFSGSIAPSGYTFMIWYDTTNNLIKFTTDSGSTWESGQSFPFGIVSGDNSTGNWYSIDQIFNGFGYIGSTVFALPGVKCLIPNGFNGDGTLHNTLKTFTSVRTTTFPNDFNLNSANVGITGNLDIDIQFLTYNEKENLNYNSVPQKVLESNVATLDIQNGRITSFTPKTVFHTLDYNDKEIVASWAMPSNKYITLTLGASGATYTAPANGYFTLFGHVNSAEMYNTSGSNLYWGVNGPTSTFKGVSCLAKKGDIVKIYYTTYGDNVIFRFIYAEGEI